MVEAAAAKAHWKSQKEKGWKSEKFIDNANWPHPMKPLDVWCLPHTPYAKPYPMSLRMGAGDVGLDAPGAKRFCGGAGDPGETLMLTSTKWRRRRRP